MHNKNQQPGYVIRSHACHTRKEPAGGATSQHQHLNSTLQCRDESGLIICALSMKTRPYSFLCNSTKFLYTIALHFIFHIQSIWIPIPTPKSPRIPPKRAGIWYTIRYWLKLAKYIFIQGMCINFVIFRLT